MPYNQPGGTFNSGYGTAAPRSYSTPQSTGYRGPTGPQGQPTGNPVQSSFASSLARSFSSTSGGGNGGSGWGGHGNGGDSSTAARTSMGSKMGGASTQQAMGNAGQVTARSLQQAKEQNAITRQTALSNVIAASRMNAGNYPTQGSGGNRSYGGDIGAVFRTMTPGLGQPSTPNWSNDRGQFDRWGVEALANFYGRSSPQISEMVRTIAGEAANQTANQRAAVANVMENRLALGDRMYGGGSIPGMLRAFDANGYDARRVGAANMVYRNAAPGRQSYTNGLQAMADVIDPASSFNQTAPDAVRNATHYFNPQTADPRWGRNFTADYGDHRFGNAGNTAQRVADARGNRPVMGRDTGVIQMAEGDAIPVPAGSNVVGEVVNGEIVPRVVAGGQLPRIAGGMSYTGGSVAPPPQQVADADGAGRTWGDVFKGFTTAAYQKGADLIATGKDAIKTANDPLNRLAISLLYGNTGGNSLHSEMMRRAVDYGHSESPEYPVASVAPVAQPPQPPKPIMQVPQWQFPQYSQTWAFTPPPVTYPGGYVFT